MASLNPALRGFYETKGARNFVLYGGRASSKTYHTAGFCVFLAVKYRVKFLCVRQFQSRISDSVKTVIEECVRDRGIEDQFRITDTEIEHLETGSSFIFLGIQRNIREIKGIAGIDILWIEEAEDLTTDQWDVLEPTIRADYSKVFIVFNPRFAHDFVYKHFVTNTPKNTIVRKINYDENPYLSNTMREVIAAAKDRDYDNYLHIYEGEPLDDDDSVIIKRSWILASIDAHIKLKWEMSGQRIIGFDVADSGSDKCAMMQAHGSTIVWSDEWKGKEDELMMSCQRVWSAARERESTVTYDSIGVGAGSGSKFNELNDATVDGKVRHSKFNAGGAVHRPDAYYDQASRVKNKDQFFNVKAQAWWAVADRFRNTYNAVMHGHRFAEDEMISIASDVSHIKKLIDELSTPNRQFVNGKVKVESKEDLLKRGIQSPNLADAAIMCFIPGIEPMAVSDLAVRQFGGSSPAYKVTLPNQQVSASAIAAFQNMGRTR